MSANPMMRAWRPKSIVPAGPTPFRPLAAVAALAGSVVLSGCVTVEPSRERPATPTQVVVQPAAFDVVETYVAGAPPAPQWTGVLARHRRAVGQPQEVPPEWRRLVETLRDLDPLARVERANAEINRVPYARSEVNWARRDYWETPFELLAGSGQCQDFAVAKYLLLRDAGVPADQLRVVVVQDQRAGLAHAVLLAYVDGRALVLDNQVEGVVAASQLAHYEPIYALGEGGWWMYGRPQRPGRDAAAALSRTAFAGF